MEIKSHLSYCPDTGLFIWYNPTAKNIEPGTVAGTLHNGYIQIEFNYRLYRAHRLAWYFHYGEWPNGQIDHINRDRADNRIENLRVVNNRQNSHNKLDFKYGVSKHHNKFNTRMRINGIKRHIGSFDTFEEAKEAYLNKLEEL